MKIYLKLEKPPETIKELLSALYGNTGISASSTTYKDEKCTIVQCPSGRRRSYNDIEDLVDTYFPNTTRETLLHELITFNVIDNSNRKLYFYPHSCGTIQRLTVLYNASPPTSITYKMGNYDWEKLLNLLNINNAVELNAYREKHTSTVKSN